MLAATLVASSLVSRRIPIGKAAKMAIAWVLIFGGFFLIFAFRDDFSAIGQKLKAEVTGSAISNGAEVRIPVSEDGHFWVNAEVNGTVIRMMVDSGASVTTVGRQDAAAADVSASSRRGVVETANGPTLVTQGEAGRLEVGSIVRTDFPVDISDRDDVSLLGMNFLSTLRSWKVEGNYLVLTP